MKDQKRTWVIRPRPHHELRIDEFLRDELVALGWPGLGSLAGMNREQIKDQVGEKYKITDSRILGRHAGALNAFINDLAPGDRVIVPTADSTVVYIGEIRGKYIYNARKDAEGYPHQRKVNWLLDARPFPRQHLPPSVVRSLRAQQPIIAVGAGALDALLRGHASSKHRQRPALQLISYDFDTDGNISSIEGEQVQKLVTRSKRDRRLRDTRVRQALAEGGGRLKCEVPGCGFDFEDVYGELGRHFAHVHHRDQLGSSGRRRRTSLRDLIIICCNCHAMIHRRGACRRVEELIPRQK